MPERPARPVENFTRAFLVSGFFALFTLLVLVWAIWGYGWALAVGAAIWGLLRVTSP